MSMLQIAAHHSVGCSYSGMNCIQKSLFILSLFNVFHIQRVFGRKEIVEKRACTDLFERSVVKSAGNAPYWGHHFMEKICAICQADNQLKSWLLTRPFETKDYESIHVGLEMARTRCEKCKNQRIKVYILHHNSMQTPRTSPEMLGNLTLVETLVNKVDSAYEFHNFWFVPEKSKFSLVLLSEGSCTRIKIIEISAFVCERNIIKGVNLTRTISPATGFKRKNATCNMKNALNLENAEPYGLCSSNGTWDVQSPCKCKIGFAIGTVGYCVECKSNTYKSSIGNEKCTPCPKNSVSEKGQTQCQCNDGFYRFERANYGHPCYGIPSEVRYIKVLERTETTITLQWQQPQKQYQGAVYEIECNKCPLSTDSAPCEEQCGRSVTFIPSQTDLKYTNVIIRGLEQNTEYQFVIYSKNKYSDRINKTNWKNSVKKIKTEGGANDKLKTPEIIAIAFGVAIFLFIIIVVALLFRRRRSAAQSLEGDVNSKNNGQNSLLVLETLHNRNIEAEYVDILEDWEISPRDLKVLNKNLGAGHFGVVKQGLYKPQNGDPERVAVKMLKENAAESELLDLLAEIKVLKEANKEKHPNIIKFIGSCFMKGRLLMVTEFCPGGNLRKFLIKSRINDNSSDSHNIYVNITSTISDRQLLKLAVDVACGMVHLSSQKFLHRDLAARNILLGKESVAKICDFGLARDVGSAEEYIRNTQNLLPVKWMSVESLFDGVFTTASDVWSFGVLLYEIATLGEEPYKNIPARAVITHVESGGRMSKPPHCSNEVYELMSNCWKVDPKERPTFPEIFQALRDMLNDREHTYINVTQVKDGLQMAVQSAVRG
ncbi:tyrosine-protein kinase receptor Tie-1-like isoform X2 [Dendronephthya gigantea]|uniref:tyrosine-protein kinase receptor Tie-1-like isoform X2 n=1 Tax=Dendronephthya gigantea TaxID=151771 RepID=UPI00106AE233|nr:tyrosine-protein kinase receptor Tie-1-like isoform X2 [Dendronephthya gigantea]